MEIKPLILIFGASSKIARKTFESNFKNYEIIGYSRFANLKKIKEYKVFRFKNSEEILKIITKNKYNKVIAIFFESYSISNLIINKSKNELLDEIKKGIINSHQIVGKILPIMIKHRWGRIVHVGSSRALKGDAGISGYMTTKYAALGYSKSISREYGRFGITSNYLSLGLFDTPLLSKVKKNDLKNILRNTDTRSIGNIKSVANALKFIIDSDYVTGSTINVDGGYN